MWQNIGPLWSEMEKILTKTKTNLTVIQSEIAVLRTVPSSPSSMAWLAYIAKEEA